MWNKGLIVTSLFLLSFLEIQAQTPPRIINSDSLNYFVSQAVWDTSKTPKNPPTPIDLESVRKARWSYFWMWNDGIFVKDTSRMVRQLSNNNTREVMLAVRGHYTPDKEPPTKLTQNIRPTGTIAGTDVAVPPYSLSNNTAQAGLEIQSNASLVGDTVFFALTVRNNTEQNDRSAQLVIRYPSDSLQYLGSLFGVTEASTLDIPTADGFPPSTLMYWNVSDIDRGQQKTLFFKLMVTDKMHDNGEVFIMADVNWLDQQSSAAPVNLLGFVKGNSIEGSQKPTVTFDNQAQTALAVKKGRDPNRLEVWPQSLEPENSNAKRLIYTVQMENLGNAPVNDITVQCTMDNRLKMSTVALVGGSLEFPNIGASISPLGISGQNITFVITTAGLSIPGSGSNTGKFQFEIYTSDTENFREGDVISSHGIITFKNGTAIFDQVRTNDANTHIRKNGRLPYGCVLGLKFDHQIPGLVKDSVQGSGVSLVFMAPLINSRKNTLNGFGHPPCLIYQAEAGYGLGRFQADNGLIIKTKYIRLNPLQLRYARRDNMVNSSTKFTWGVSAGYSIAYIFDADAAGSTLVLPEGFGNKLEHEIAASVDAFNIVGVPGLSFSLGYKLKSNKISGNTVQYNYPYMSVQFNFFRFHKHFTQWLNQVKYR